MIYCFVYNKYHICEVQDITAVDFIVFLKLLKVKIRFLNNVSFVLMRFF